MGKICHCFGGTALVVSACRYKSLDLELVQSLSGRGMELLVRDGIASDPGNLSLDNTTTPCVKLMSDSRATATFLFPWSVAPYMNKLMTIASVSITSPEYETISARVSSLTGW